MQPDKLMLSLFLKSAIWFGLMGALLFAAAGDWRWPQGWAFVVVFFFGSILFSLWLMRRDPALLAARLGPLSQKGQPLWDKIFLIVFVLVVRLACADGPGRQALAQLRYARLAQFCRRRIGDPGLPGDHARIP